MGFDNWSIHKNILLQRKAFQQQYCWRVFEVVKNKSHCLTYTVASSCVCTLNIGGFDDRGTARFRQSIHFSITQVLSCWSCALTLRSRQQILVPQVSEIWCRQTIFRRWEECCSSCSFHFRTLWASLRAASRAPCSCHSVSSWDRSSNCGALGLHWWGSPGQIYPSEGFWSRKLVWRTTALVNRTHRTSFRMSELFRKTGDPGIRKPIGKYFSAWLLHFCHHSYWTCCSAVLQTVDAHESTFAQFCNHSCSWRTRILEDATFHRKNWCKFLWSKPCMTFETFSHFGPLPPGSRRISLILPHERNRRRIWCSSCTLIHIVAETAIVSVRALPIGFPLPAIS